MCVYVFVCVGVGACVAEARLVGLRRRLAGPPSPQRVAGKDGS